MPDIFVSNQTKLDSVEKSDKPVNAPLPEKAVNKAIETSSPDERVVTRKVPSTEEERSEWRAHSHNPLSAYLVYPDPEKMDFESKEEGEDVVLFLRQHPIVNAGWIFIAALMVFLPLITTIVPIVSFLPGRFQFVILLIWYLFIFTYILENFMDWFFNIYIVTTERVVDIDFQNLLYKRVSDADLDKIQDVTYTTGGILRTMFNYGDVFIQTAAEVSEFDFLAVPNPDKVARIINELKMAEEKDKFGTI